ncbi:hypothetical protein C4D60_Mb06t08030 [Musa balbisiana]|uniref:Heparan-alpha-glucosaminide N-acetyltransferase catalytic domain-containing protein n=1 Tax=Musa balbisiana TaxID=52838 RepID=A0A4S8ILE6_MUSBA|nr:hypothetical protein C4D60_Mb06t08030 [Musa balbisiana]
MEAKKEIEVATERDAEVVLQVAGEGGNGGKEEGRAAMDVSSRSRRVAALDAFRGLTIVMMILVDDAGGAYEKIDHSPWNGCTLADFVMPFFLFIVGVAIALALKRITQVSAAVKKIVIRTLKLLLWGLILQGGYSHAPDDLSYGVDMKKIRWIFGCVAFVVYMATTYALYVPDWSFVFHREGDVNDGKRFVVKCGVRGNLDPACNAVGYVDRAVWGINHLYTQPVWIRSKGHSERLKHWLLMGFGLLICGITLHFTNAIPLNKQLYSFSYVCFTAGSAGIVLSAFYAMIDVWGIRTPFLWLEWVGMNAMLVFVMAAQGIFPAFVNGWYYETPDNSLVHWIQRHVFVKVWHSERLGMLLYVLFAEIVFWAVVAGILHKLGLYWKL